MITAKNRRSIKKIAVVTTTIHTPTLLSAYVLDRQTDSSSPLGQVELDIIVSGDVSTPTEARECVEKLGGTYLGVDDAATTRWKTHRQVGTYSIQRRNIATLHALATGADVIITVDDDNEPHYRHLHRIIDEFQPGMRRLLSAPDGLWNPGSLLTPPTWQRGFPLDRRRDSLNFTSESKWLDNVGVVQGLTTGDPDIDAIERIVNNPTCDTIVVDENVVLDYGLWAPFNTQNTAITRELAPLLQCMVHVGRYDDILASYIARAVMDVARWRVSYGHPLTHSVRNEHNLVKDLEQELLGYKILPKFITRLREADITADAPILDQYVDAFDAVSGLLSMHTSEATDAWITDVETALEEGDSDWT
jgi:hypothetical protein